MHVAVAHVGAVHEDRVVEQRAVTIGRICQLLNEGSKAFNVVALDQHQLTQALQVVGVVRQRMEGIGHADMVVRAVGAFGDHDVGRHAGKVGLIREREQVEQQFYLFVEVVELAHRRSRNFEVAQILRGRQVHAPFNFTHCVEIAFENDAVGSTQRTFQCFGAGGDQIKKAGLLLDDGFAFC